jgi:hypothetical protein
MPYLQKKKGKGREEDIRRINRRMATSEAKGCVAEFNASYFVAGVKKTTKPKQ